MKIYIIAGLVAAVLGIIVYFFVSKKRIHLSSDKYGRSNEPGVNKSTNVEMNIMFEDFPDLTEKEENSLREITDPVLLAKISNIVPGSARIIENVKAVAGGNNLVETAGKVYRAVLKKGGQLVESKELKGAVRGFTRNAKGIKENANWVEVDLKNPIQKLANVNVTNVVMGAAAMVVGQYYMTQINNELKDIKDSISGIASFQNNEYKGKVSALIAEVMTCSNFRTEIIEDERVCERQLHQLNDLQYDCAKLLGTANFSLRDITHNNTDDYKQYEEQVKDAQHWYQYQQTLLQISNKIAELMFVLNRGKDSREHCYAMCLPYQDQSMETLTLLKNWHEEAIRRFDIDVLASHRGRKGLNRIVMGGLSIFDKNLSHINISEVTASMIGSQSSLCMPEQNTNDIDLYKEDVSLVIKEGKMFYLPVS